MDTKARIIFGFLLVCNTLLILFLTSYSIQTRRDITELRAVLATKDDLTNLKVTHSEAVLEETCTQCHAENRFASFHGSESEMLEMIKRMAAQANSHISAKDVDAIHASLELLQCNTCHEQNRLRTLALETGEEQKRIIREMLMKSQETAGSEEVERLHRSYQQLFGF